VATTANSDKVLSRKKATLVALAASGRVPVAKPERIRAICEVDVTGMLEMLRSISEAAWDTEDAAKENAFPVFRQTRHIVARFSDPRGGPETHHSNGTWHQWESELRPLLDQIAKHYGLSQPDYSKVMLARLRAGGQIDPHYDVGISNHLTHKIHVPLITNTHVRFVIAGETFHLPAGKAYELNNVAVHEVQNGGEQDRIHLIFELFDRGLPV
jgi:hypothetical protein